MVVDLVITVCLAATQSVTWDFVISADVQGHLGTPRTSLRTLALVWENGWVRGEIITTLLFAVVWRFGIVCLCVVAMTARWSLCMIITLKDIHLESGY